MNQINERKVSMVIKRLKTYEGIDGGGGTRQVYDLHQMANVAHDQINNMLPQEMHHLVQFIVTIHNK